MIGSLFIKICGITRVADGVRAAELGATAVGMVFVRDSPRRISVEQARRVSAALPRWVLRVGVFAGAPLGEVEAVYRRCRLDMVQLHGEESGAYLGRLRDHGIPALKAFRVPGKKDLAPWRALPLRRARHAPLGLHTSPSSARGTGTVAARRAPGTWGARGAAPKRQWRARSLPCALVDAPWGSAGPLALPLARAASTFTRVILAGGLTPANVRRMIRAVRPYGVDVSRGVEVRPGIKDHRKLRKFFDAVRGA